MHVCIVPFSLSKLKGTVFFLPLFLSFLSFLPPTVEDVELKNEGTEVLVDRLCEGPEVGGACGDCVSSLSSSASKGFAVSWMTLDLSCVMACLRFGSC